MQHLVMDPNSRIRLIAASSLLFAEPGHAKAGAVLMEALGDPALRVREAALELLESLGTGGAALLEGLKLRDGPDGENPQRGEALGLLSESLASHGGQLVA